MLKKTALSCAASLFTAVPGRQCHKQSPLPPPANPAPPASHPPFSSSAPKPHSILSQLVLTPLSPASPAHPISPQKIPLANSQHSPNPTTHHSHIFQKVLTNAFLLFTPSAAKH
ncbi:hypothetical protein KP13_32173 [Klebsiella pneumoniae subsp. pneumoniae Kp13]|nr:hypothetical protein KP13_32173 [Klebsiella pneumoniae subsp. pneumoniae Kp13]